MSKLPDLTPPPGLHQRVTADAEDDSDPYVAGLGACGKVYAALEECMGENDRDWRKCQKEVQALKDCHAKVLKPKGRREDK